MRRGESRALCQLKRPFKGLRLRGDSCWEEPKRKISSLNKGSLICPPGKSMILYKKETEKIKLVARPEVSQTYEKICDVFRPLSKCDYLRDSGVKAPMLEIDENRENQVWLFACSLVELASF